MVVNKKPNILKNKYYEQLKEDVKNVKAKTDSKPPKLKVATYLKIGNIGQDKAKLKSNFKANMEMLETVNVIQRTTGFVDSFMLAPRSGDSKAKAKMKIREIQNLEKTNRELLRRFNAMVIMSS